MPWNEVTPMEQRVLFIADYLRQLSSISDLCAQYGISRKTGYKWIERFKQAGLEGLHERSRRPASCHLQTPYRLSKASSSCVSSSSPRPVQRSYKSC